MMKIVLLITLCLLEGFYAGPNGTHVSNRGNIPNSPVALTWNGKYPREKIRQELDKSPPTNNVNNEGNEENIPPARRLEEESNDDDETVYDDGDPVARALQFPDFIPPKQSFHGVEIAYPGTSNVVYPANTYLPPIPLSAGYQKQQVIGYPGTYPNSPVIGNPGRLPSGPIVNQVAGRPVSQAVADLLAQLLPEFSRPPVVIINGRPVLGRPFSPLTRPPYPPLGGSYYRQGGGQSPPIIPPIPPSVWETPSLGRQFPPVDWQIPPLGHQIPSSGEPLLPSQFDFYHLPSGSQGPPLNSQGPLLGGQVSPINGQLGGQFIPSSGRQQFQRPYPPGVIPPGKSQLIPYIREPPAGSVIGIGNLPLLIKQSPLPFVGTPLLPHPPRRAYYSLEHTGPPTPPAHIVGHVYNPPGQPVGEQVAQGQSEAENEQIAHVQNYRNEPIHSKSKPSSEQLPPRNPDHDDEEGLDHDDIFDSANDPNEDSATNDSYRKRASPRKGEHRPQNNDPNTYKRSDNNLPPSYRYRPEKRSAMFEPVRLEEEQ